MIVPWLRKHPMIVVLALGGVAVGAVLLSMVDGGLLRTQVGGQSPSPSNQLSAYLYLDTEDGGDDVFNPGCLELFYENFSSNITQCHWSRQFLVYGDACKDNVTLSERYRPTSCSWLAKSGALEELNYVTKIYNCRDECMKAGRGHGYCRPTTNTCKQLKGDGSGGGGQEDQTYTDVGSAYCHCEKLNTPSPAIAQPAPSRASNTPIP